MSRRRSAGRRPYDRVLIVTEGAESEPSYFRDLCADPEHKLPSVDVDSSADSDPLSVVEHGLRQYVDDGDYDRLYCVFDRDRHDGFQDAVEWLRDKRDPPEWNVFWTFSVPCFEYWVLLHFEDTASPYPHPDSPCRQVIRDVEDHLPHYRKGMSDLYDRTKPHLENAKERARRRWQQARGTNALNPSTKIHKLVSYLQDIRS